MEAFFGSNRTELLRTDTYSRSQKLSDEKWEEAINNLENHEESTEKSFDDADKVLRRYLYLGAFEDISVIEAIRNLFSFSVSSKKQREK